jgi:hypothetical protein
MPAGPLTIITTRSQEQAALAITGGYRGRFRWSDDASTRDGVYVAVNYNYLIGLWYVDDNLGVQIDPADVVIDRVSATSGRGMAIDTGAGIVIGRWEFGGGVNGVGNRIHWRGVSHRTIASGNLLTGGLLGQPGVVSARPDVEVSVPVDLRGNLAYRAEGWMAVAEIGHGIVGSTAHAGVEARVAPAVTVRGGLAYSFGDWNPTGGLGVDISRRFGVDVAAFATTANFERRRKLALAASIRVMS